MGQLAAEMISSREDYSLSVLGTKRKRVEEGAIPGVGVPLNMPFSFLHGYLYQELLFASDWQPNSELFHDAYFLLAMNRFLRSEFSPTGGATG